MAAAAKDKSNPFKVVMLAYQLYMLDGQTSLADLQSDRYPEVKLETFAQFAARTLKSGNWQLMGFVRCDSVVRLAGRPRQRREHRSLTFVSSGQGDEGLEARHQAHQGWRRTSVETSSTSLPELRERGVTRRAGFAQLPKASSKAQASLRAASGGGRAQRLPCADAGADQEAGRGPESAQARVKLKRSILDGPASSRRARSAALA